MCVYWELLDIFIGHFSHHLNGGDVVAKWIACGSLNAHVMGLSLSAASWHHQADTCPKDIPLKKQHSVVPQQLLGGYGTIQKLHLNGLNLYSCILLS